jgi:hypothetical protein
VYGLRFVDFDLLIANAGIKRTFLTPIEGLQHVILFVCTVGYHLVDSFITIYKSAFDILVNLGSFEIPI